MLWYKIAWELPCYSTSTWMNPVLFKGFMNEFHPSEWCPEDSSLEENELIWKEVVVIFKTRNLLNNMKTSISAKEAPERGVNRDRSSIQCGHFETQTLLLLYLNCHKSITCVFCYTPYTAFNATFILISSVILNSTTTFILQLRSWSYSIHSEKNKCSSKAHDAFWRYLTRIHLPW
jgi:hypothetical protein